MKLNYWGELKNTLKDVVYALVSFTGLVVFAIVILLVLAIILSPTIIGVLFGAHILIAILGQIIGTFLGIALVTFIGRLLLKGYVIGGFKTKTVY